MSPQRYVVWHEPGTGCGSCGRGHNWFVVDRVTDTASSVSFDEEDDAADLADFMNEAYECGVAAVGVNLNLPSGHSFRDEDGDGLCDYVTDFSATERRCLKLRPDHDGAESPTDGRSSRDPKIAYPPGFDWAGGDPGPSVRGMDPSEPSIDDGDPKHGGYGHVCSPDCDIWKRPHVHGVGFDARCEYCNEEDPTIMVEEPDPEAEG